MIPFWIALGRAGFKAKISKLKRSKHLKNLVRLPTSVLAIVREVPQRSKNLSMVELSNELNGEVHPSIVFRISEKKLSVINQAYSSDKCDGYKQLYVYYITTIRSELREFNNIA